MMAGVSKRPQAWSMFTTAQARRVAGVLTDIDDTLTAEGAITADALAALHALRAAGLPVIAVTGRPLGWSSPFARDWPLDAIVAENGAVAVFREGVEQAGRARDTTASHELRIEYAQDAATRAANALRLAAVARRLLAEVLGSTLARDSAGRVTDIAIDHAEYAHLDAEQIERCVAVMREEGMNATVSSIHVNGWYGEHDKLSGARWIVRRLFGRDLEAERADWVYVGDSTNDQRMFSHFDASVGVANLMDFADRLEVWPAYLTRAARGAGFAEVAHRLIEARGESQEPRRPA